MGARKLAPYWTLFSTHGQVLLCLASDPSLRLRDLAAATGLTERAVQMLVADLEQAGLVTRRRVGRRNAYELHPATGVACGLGAELPLGEVLRWVAPKATRA